MESSFRGVVLKGLLPNFITFSSLASSTHTFVDMALKSTRTPQTVLTDQGIRTVQIDHTETPRGKAYQENRESIQSQIDSALGRSQHLMRDLETSLDDWSHGGAKKKTTRRTESSQVRENRRRALSGERRPGTDFLWTPDDVRRTGRDGVGTARADSASPDDIVSSTVRQSPEQSVREAVESYMEALSQSTEVKCKVPPVDPPKFKIGGDWRCFLAEFKEMVQLADLKPTHQLAYFKRSIPEEAKKMLYQHKVESVQQAIQMLTELYEPVKDTWTVLQELEKISQKPGERLRVLAGRIEEVARRYDETLETTSPTDLNRLIVSRFKYAIADEETRNHLLWDPTEMTLDQMVQKAQQFEDARQATKANKKSLRAAGENQECDRLKKEIAELRKLVEELQTSKTTTTPRKYSGVCWNCGEKGHFSRRCPHDKVGDGFSHRPKKRVKSEPVVKTTSSTPSLN